MSDAIEPPTTALLIAKQIDCFHHPQDMTREMHLVHIDFPHGYSMRKCENSYTLNSIQARSPWKSAESHLQMMQLTSFARVAFCDPE